MLLEIDLHELSARKSRGKTVYIVCTVRDVRDAYYAKQTTNIASLSQIKDERLLTE